MKFQKLLLIFVLILALSVSAVYAQDAAPEAEPTQEAVTEAEPEKEESLGGFLKSLFGEGGPLADVVPAGTDIDAMLTSASEQLSQVESELDTVFNSVVEKAKNKGIDFSLDSLKEYAVSFLSEMTGAGDFGFGPGLDQYMDTIAAIRAVEEQYYKDHNADMMDPAEIQFISNCTLFTEEHPEFSDYNKMETRTINYMTQLNFVKNEANQLVFVSGGSDVVMFTVRPDEEGNFSVVSAKFSEDGVNYKPSIEAMLTEVGAADQIAETMDEIEFGRVMVPYDLEQYLGEHPEYTAIEYGGEMRTAKDLDAMWSEDVKTLFAEPADDPEPAAEPAPAE